MTTKDYHPIMKLNMAFKPHRKSGIKIRYHKQPNRELHGYMSSHSRLKILIQSIVSGRSTQRTAIRNINAMRKIYTQ